MSKDPRAEFDSTPHAPTEIPPHIVATARTLAQRGLGRAALLFVMGHAPLAFMAGTVLHGMAPLYGLLAGDMQGQLSDAGRRLGEWGDFLGESQSLAALRAHLLLEDVPRGPRSAATAETHAHIE